MSDPAPQYVDDAVQAQLHAQALAEAQAQHAQMQADAIAQAQIHAPMFSILKKGASTAAGPYSQSNILALLQNGEVDKDDFVYYEGLPDWQKVEDVFEIDEHITHFIDDGQDPELVALAFREISEVMKPDEEIFYIAVQNKAGILSKTRYCIGMTNRRTFLIQKKRSTHEIEAHPWSNVSNTMMRDDGNKQGTFSILLRMQRRVDVNHLPIDQVHRLFEVSQELTEDGDNDGDE